MRITAKRLRAGDRPTRVAPNGSTYMLGMGTFWYYVRYPDYGGFTKWFSLFGEALADWERAGTHSPEAR